MCFNSLLNKCVVQKQARRLGESTKMDGGAEMPPSSAKNVSKMGSKKGSETSSQNGAQMEQNAARIDAKRHPQIDVFLVRFLDASGNIGGSCE